jgi:hypothetical protein
LVTKYHFSSEDDSTVEGHLKPGLFNPKLQPRTFSSQASNPSFNPGLFNHELFNPMVQKFMVEKSGIEKFMVEKSGVERSGVETWG